MRGKQPQDDVTIDELARLARRRVADFLKADDHTTMQIAEIRVATGVLATYARVKQTAGAREALTFMMARELAGDREQLADYIRATMPGAAIVKALPGKAT
jgi:hypothetical protein